MSKAHSKQRDTVNKVNTWIKIAIQMQSENATYCQIGLVYMPIYWTFLLPVSHFLGGDVIKHRTHGDTHWIGSFFKFITVN